MIYKPPKHLKQNIKSLTLLITLYTLNSIKLVLFFTSSISRIVNIERATILLSKFV